VIICFGVKLNFCGTSVVGKVDAEAPPASPNVRPAAPSTGTAAWLTRFRLEASFSCSIVASSLFERLLSIPARKTPTLQQEGTQRFAILNSLVRSFSLMNDIGVSFLNIRVHLTTNSAMMSRRRTEQTMMSHALFAWYDLLTTDMAAARSFYESVLGWTARDVATSRFAYSVFNAGDAPVCGFMELPEEGKKIGAMPRWVGYVAVDDLDSTVERLRRLGGEVYVPPTNTDTGRIAFVADPQGATLALAQGLKHDLRPSEAEQLGRVGWHELLAGEWKAAFAFYHELFGWQRTPPEVGSVESYQLLSAGDRTIGGMFNKLPIAPMPFWLYYFNVPDIAVATDRVIVGGGRIVHGSNQLPDGGWIAWCVDPQGAMFALQAASNQSDADRLGAAELGWSTTWGAYSSRGRLVADPPSRPPSKLKG
jgi:uncharacterized protein